jgi:thiol:disulfide interchange protein DsbC
MRLIKWMFGMCLVASSASWAQEATIRKNLEERLPQIQKIDEINKSQVNGVYEVRVNGTEILYTDSEANYLFQGSLIDLRQRRNLTDERIEKLTAISFTDLPLKDAVVEVRGNGKRKVAVFADPNCGFCKRFERDLEKVGDLTVYTFLYPILGADSTEKSKNIWCAKDKAKAWQGWMLKNQTPPALSATAAANCDNSAVLRNVELGRKLKITGTPTLVFADGVRVPGAINTAQIEKMLSDVK